MTENNFYIERNSPSDEEFFIHRIFVSNGDFVKKETLLAEVEGAKAVFEIYSDREGFFYTQYKNGEYVEIDSAFAIISKSEKNNVLETTEEIANEKNTINFSKPAKQYIIDNNLNIENELNSLSKLELVTVNDIKKIIQKSQESKRFEIEIKKENLDNWKILNSKKNREPLYIVGGGYGAYQVLDLIVDSEKYYLAGYFDDNINTKLDFLGINRLGSADEKSIINVLNEFEFKNVLISISNNPKFRSKFENLDKLGINLVTLVHSTVIIGSNTKIGKGSLIFAGVHIGPDTEIGSMSFISSNSTIEHHNNIGKAFCCGPNFSSSGIVEIGDLVRTGINVGIEPFIKIGSGVVLASGVIVSKNVESNEVVKYNK